MKNMSNIECPNCGAINDIIYSKCLFCNTTLPNSNLNKLSNDELIEKITEWVGNLEGINTISGLVVYRESSTGINKFFGQRDTMNIPYNAVIGYIEKFLQILYMRSLENSELMVFYNTLNAKYYKNKKKAEFRLKKIGLFTVLGFVLIYVFFGFVVTCGINSENKEENERFNHLNQIEYKIEKSLDEGKYEKALIQVEQLNWTWDLDHSKNKKTAEEYELKKENYRKAIRKLIESKKEDKN